MQAQQAAAQSEVQKNQALTAQKAELEQLKGQIEMTKLQAEVEAKKELMAQEFEYNMQLKGIETDGQKTKESDKEDRKDERTKLQASQQSKLIEQRQNNTPAQSFESSGNDVLSQGMGLGSFEPR